MKDTDLLPVLKAAVDALVGHRDPETNAQRRVKLCRALEELIAVLEPPPVIVAFRTTETGEKYVFAATSRNALLADTNSGREFGQVKFQRAVNLTLDELRSFGFPFLDKALRAVTEARAAKEELSYLVGILDENDEPTERTPAEWRTP